MRSARMLTKNVTVTSTPAPLDSVAPVESSTILIANKSAETINIGTIEGQHLQVPAGATFSFDDVFPNEAEAYFSTATIYVSCSTTVEITYCWVEISN